MKKELSKISQDLEQGMITDNEARALLLDLLGVMSMLPTNEEIVKHAESSTDFWQRNGRDMSIQKHYFYAGADMVKRFFGTKKGDATGNYS